MKQLYKKWIKFISKCLLKFYLFAEVFFLFSTLYSLCTRDFINELHNGNALNPLLIKKLPEWPGKTMLLIFQNLRASSQIAIDLPMSIQTCVLKLLSERDKISFSIAYKRNSLIRAIEPCTKQYFKELSVN